MNLKIIISIILIINFVGCTKKEKLKMDTPPKMQAIKKVEPIVKNKGSLYSRRGASLFADKKDLQRGDIIQVLINESLQNTSSSKRDTSKENSTGINGGLVTKLGAVGGTPVASSTSANGILGIGLSGGSNNTFSGSAKSSDDEEFVTSVSAIIEQTYQNGNYFIKGTKQLLINGQKQFIMISGIVRPYDIETDNTVKSNRIANLKILFGKEGSDADSLEKPWGSEFIESISPF
ncbi:MAG: flagellar basal body L-ring protein FlgH [Campylobacterota bacterium]|nr:flagellar basal body L-ring protein FlgH [Campylobacterota bacterium]